MFSIHATKKLLDRVKQPVTSPVPEPTTTLGNWYATALFWGNRAIRLAAGDSMRQTLQASGIAADFIEFEIAAMAEGRYAKTANWSVVGIMNEFRHLAEVHRAHRGLDDLVALALELSETPCGPLYERHVSPEAGSRLDLLSESPQSVRLTVADAVNIGVVRIA